MKLVTVDQTSGGRPFIGSEIPLSDMRSTQGGHVTMRSPIKLPQGYAYVVVAGGRYNVTSVEVDEDRNHVKGFMAAPGVRPPYGAVIEDPGVRIVALEAVTFRGIQQEVVAVAPEPEPVIDDAPAIEKKAPKKRSRKGKK